MNRCGFLPSGNGGHLPWLVTLVLSIQCVSVEASFAADDGPAEAKTTATSSDALKADSTSPAFEKGEAKAPNSDPLEKMNRGIFWINEVGDKYLVAPAAQVWRWVTPSFFRTAVVNVNRLILMPAILANDLLQLKPEKAGEDFCRVVINASFGLAGLVDVASMVDIPQNDEDFGQTLGYWGVPAGPYLMLPLFGPATIRDGVGRLADSGATFYFTLLPIWGTVIIRGVDLLNLRSKYLEEVDQSRRDAFDYYVFMREAYLQNRRAKLDRALGIEEQQAADDDLYYFDDEELEFEEYDDEVERKIEEKQKSSKSNPPGPGADVEGTR